MRYLLGSVSKLKCVDLVLDAYYYNQMLLSRDLKSSDMDLISSVWQIGVHLGIVSGRLVWYGHSHGDSEKV